MASQWPTSVDTLKEDFTNSTPNLTTAANWQNLVSQAVKQVQTILGSGIRNPQGVYASVGLRLDSRDFERAINGKGVVKHGTDPNVARPTTPGYASYEWQGTVAPNNAIDGDTWISTV